MNQNDLYNTPGFKEGRRRWALEHALPRAVPQTNSVAYKSIEKVIEEAEQIEEYLTGSETETATDKVEPESEVVEPEQSPVEPDVGESDPPEAAAQPDPVMPDGVRKRRPRAR